MLSIYTFSTMIGRALSNARAAELLSGIDTEVIDMTGTRPEVSKKAINSNLATGGCGDGRGSGGSDARSDRAARRARRAAGAGSLADARGPDD